MPRSTSLARLACLPRKLCVLLLFFLFLLTAPLEAIIAAYTGPILTKFLELAEK